MLNAANAEQNVERIAEMVAQSATVQRCHNRTCNIVAGNPDVKFAGEIGKMVLAAVRAGAIAQQFVKVGRPQQRNSQGVLDQPPVNRRSARSRRDDLLRLKRQ
ncbi:MAG: hypothetical protein Pars2KO_29610 [Parasphingorhabdus sp.]